VVVISGASCSCSCSFGRELARRAGRRFSAWCRETRRAEKASLGGANAARESRMVRARAAESVDASCLCAATGCRDGVPSETLREGLRLWKAPKE